MRKKKIAVATCAGSSVGGFCWYLGANDATCTTVCATHGGYSSGTLTYTGSSGTFAHCQQVVLALTGWNIGSYVSDAMSGYGCSYSDGMSIWMASGATTAGANPPSGYHRICACMN